MASSLTEDTAPRGNPVPGDKTFFGHPRSLGHSLPDRDVGAVQLLRHAGPAHPPPGRPGLRGRHEHGDRNRRRPLQRPQRHGSPATPVIGDRTGPSLYLAFTGTAAAAAGVAFLAYRGTVKRLMGDVR